MHISSLNRVLSRRSSLLYHCCCIALPLQSYLLRPVVSLAFGYPNHPSFLHSIHQQQISLSKLAMSSSTNNNSDNSSSNNSNLPRVDFTKTETVGTTRWMRLETLSYQVEPDKNNDGLRKWDRAVRTTKQSGMYLYMCELQIAYVFVLYRCGILHCRFYLQRMIVESLCIRYAHIYPSMFYVWIVYMAIVSSVVLFAMHLDMLSSILLLSHLSATLSSFDLIYRGFNRCSSNISNTQKRSNKSPTR